MNGRSKKGLKESHIYGGRKLGEVMTECGLGEREKKVQRRERERGICGEEEGDDED